MEYQIPTIQEIAADLHLEACQGLHSHSKEVYDKAVLAIQVVLLRELYNQAVEAADRTETELSAELHRREISRMEENQKHQQELEEAVKAAAEARENARRQAEEVKDLQEQVFILKLQNAALRERLQEAGLLPPSPNIHNQHNQDPESPIMAVAPISGLGTGC